MIDRTGYPHDKGAMYTAGGNGPFTGAGLANVTTAYAARPAGSGV